MYSLTEQIHSHACTDSGDVIGPEEVDNVLKGSYHIVLGYDHLCMLTSYVVSHLLCVFQVDSVGIHSDSKGAYRLIHFTLGNSADQRGVQSARQQKAHLCVCVKAFPDA